MRYIDYVLARAELARYLERARLAAGYVNQQSLAAVSGIAQQRISAYERGESIVPLKSVPRLAQALRLDEGEFMRLILAASQEDRNSLHRELSVVLDEVKQLVETYDTFRAEYLRTGAQINQLADDVAEIKQAILHQRHRGKP